MMFESLQFRKAFSYRYWRWGNKTVGTHVKFSPEAREELGRAPKGEFKRQSGGKEKAGRPRVRARCRVRGQRRADQLTSRAQRELGPDEAPRAGRWKAQAPWPPRVGEVGGRGGAGAEAAGGLGTSEKGPGPRAGREGRAAEGRPGPAATLTEGTQLRPGSAPAPLGFFAWPAGQAGGLGAPSNHAPPRAPRSQPPAPLPPATHCARPQWTDRGPGRASARISEAVGPGRRGGAGVALAQARRGGGTRDSGKCSPAIKPLTGSLQGSPYPDST